MSNNNYIERHKRILNIVSHLGLNKKKSSIPTFEKKRVSQTRIVFYKPEQCQEEEEDQLIVKAKELLSKPLKRKQIRSESQIVQMISDKYDMLKDDETEENNAYHHIQQSLVKLQEQEILGQYHEVKHNLRMSKTSYPDPVTVPQTKLQIQNMFEKKCSQHTVQSPQENTIRQKINDFLYKTRESFIDFQADVSHYQNFKQHHRLYKQRTATYFQQ
ncbi:unnamed protein product [Paramecium sonneborni]|uniref:Uncharacterized protein n=1 Tax=Paramecium sonneborni TaxID=65129 RepID=A0A8S1LVE4_9CILI|nr:unnamed protein product [Paramecium sonneborni]